MSESTVSPHAMLQSLFSELRGEWPPDQFETLFVAPPYFRVLQGVFPCVLIGGRGTGKTTALRSLRFDATGAHDAPYLGVYLKMNKSRVRAFRGSALDAAEWSRAFAHYFNIVCCLELCSLGAWLIDEKKASTASVDTSGVAATFGTKGTTIRDLAAALQTALSSLELWINNPGRSQVPLYSVAEAPLRAFATALASSGITDGKTIFCCIDEYENLEGWQQSILNTYVKHAEPPLSYKIGVRKHGLRSRETIDKNDLLVTPDDYREIDISADGFDDFAKEVILRRLKRLQGVDIRVAETIDDFLPALDLNEEARLLGAEPTKDQFVSEIKCQDAELATWLSNQTPLEVALAANWARDHPKERGIDIARAWRDNPLAWETKLSNYAHASLFWLSRGRKGTRTRKYYTGPSTLLLMASGNIRYALELLDEGVRAELADAEIPKHRAFRISAESQTKAARLVGERRLQQILGLSDRGSDLRRLMLALGRVFLEFARDASKAPETNMFVLSGAAQDQREIADLLADGVSHLAFEVFAATKLTSANESREDEYRLHPIYSAYFEYSHRKKRRVQFDACALRQVLTEPKKAIESLLGHPQLDEDELPSQLALFSDFYNGGTEGAD